MASPWKFLGRLIPALRKSGPDYRDMEDGTPGRSPGERSAADHSEGDSARSLTAASGLAIPTAEAAAGDHTPDTVVDGGAAIDRASREALPGIAISSIDGGSGLQDLAESAPVKRVRPEKIPSPVSLPITVSVPVEASSDVIDLDAEINTLRRLLAEKLRLQNLQLKKMLARFEN